MTTSKSPIDILRIAHAAAKDSLPKYSRPTSKHTYTQAQLLACLVLKEFLHQDFRGFVRILSESPSWSRVIGLKSIPHYTTLQKAEARLLGTPVFEALLNGTVKKAQEAKLLKKTVKLATVDGSGLETSYASAYYLRKKEQYAKKKGGSSEQQLKSKKFPFYINLSDCASHLTLAAWIGEGPTYETKKLPWLLRQATRRICIHTLVADAAYDSEENHITCRERFGVTSIIPPKNGRNKHIVTLPHGRYRRSLWRRFPKKIYRHRAQAESFNSMFKRTLGGVSRARSDKTRRCELRLRLITANAMIL